MFEAVIFDMDGVLVDNTEAWFGFDKKFLEQFNVVPDREYGKFVNGRSEEEVVTWIKERYNLPQSLEEIFGSRQDWARKVYEVGSTPMANIEQLLKRIRQKNLKLALCSGAKMWQIKIILDKFGWHDYFEAVVASDHVGYKGKPDPEIYLHTARLLKIDPQKCLVFEDAENGVEAALGAGMECVGYKDLRFDLVDDLSKAKFIINSFTDSKIFELLNL